MNNKSIFLAKNKEKSLLRQHPWLFSGAIQTKSPDINEGDLVNIYSINNTFLAKGFWQNDSIAVKILSFTENEDINEDFFIRKIVNAVAYRHSLGLFNNENSNIFRLINGEGDCLPSLIVDYYNGLLIVQFHSVGMFHHKDIITTALLKVLGDKCKAVFNKSSSTLPQKGKIFSKDEFLYNHLPEMWTAKENDSTYFIDYVFGQKTGFFIDQRDNRNFLTTLSKDKVVLNAFSYTGGFSLAALRGQAKEVTSIDISKRATTICQKNIDLNFQNPKHTILTLDVLVYLDNIPKNFYDIIVLDPPAFAKHKNNLSHGLKGYRAINQKAIEKIKSGGYIFTFSCSQVVSLSDFTTMLFSAAALAKRNVRIVKHLFASADHCQNIYHPEGEYLKGFIVYVE
jgi:23S rRNA (cytosine1962-C5)-methyltransferase